MLKNELINKSRVYFKPKSNVPAFLVKTYDILEVFSHETFPERFSRTLPTQTLFPGIKKERLLLLKISMISLRKSSRNISNTTIFPLLLDNLICTIFTNPNKMEKKMNSNTNYSEEDKSNFLFLCRSYNGF